MPTRSAYSCRQRSLIWVTVSLAELPPLDDPTPVESGSAFMITLGVPTALMFAVRGVALSVTGA